MKNFWESAIKSAVLIVNFLFALGKPQLTSCVIASITKRRVSAIYHVERKQFMNNGK